VTPDWNAGRGIRSFEGCSGENRYSLHCTITKAQKFFAFYTMKYDFDLKLVFLNEFYMLFHSTLQDFIILYPDFYP
jgi:hypothetical protein